MVFFVKAQLRASATSFKWELNKKNSYGLRRWLRGRGSVSADAAGPRIAKSTRKKKSAFCLLPLKKCDCSFAPLCYKEFRCSEGGTATCRLFGDVIFGDVKCVHVTFSQDRVVHLNRMSPESICYNLSNGAAVVYQLQLREESSCLGSTDSCGTVSHPTLHTYSNKMSCFTER